MSSEIQILNTIAPIGLARFSNAFTLSENTTQPRGILLRSYQLDANKIKKSVEVIARAGVGVNNIPIKYCTEQGIPVLNTPGANANAVKELVLTGMLMASRNITHAWDYAKQLCGDDDSIDQLVEKNKKQFSGCELSGKRLAVIGLGNIGLRVANIAVELGMNVIGYDAAITVKHAWQLSSQVEQAHSMADAIKQADFVSLHIPLNDKTRHIINTKFFSILKKGAILLNFARAEIVDKKALLKALNTTLRYYVCDFPSADYLQQPNVICLPHLGASTTEAEENCAMMAVDQLMLFLQHGEIKNSVNFPEVSMPRTEGFRIGLVNANVPNMLTQIAAVFSKKNVNIIDMINKSRGDIAYTLLDSEKPINKTTLSELQHIQGIVRVRQF